MSVFKPPSFLPHVSVREDLQARGSWQASGGFRHRASTPAAQLAGEEGDPSGTHSTRRQRWPFRAKRTEKPATVRPVDDRELMARISNADAAAMKSLFTRHQVRVFRFVHRILRNAAVAEELTNEVFFEVWRGARNYQGRSSATTWLLSIAHHRSLNVLRKRRELSWNAEEAAQIPDHRDDPEVASQKAGKSALLRKCSNALSPLHREIIDLVYFHETSIKEASEILDVPEGTVKARLFKARKKLQELLTAAGVDRGWP